MAPSTALMAATALLLGACRINFDVQDDGQGGDDAGPSVDAPVDTTPPMGVPRTFCERPGVCDVSGVTFDTTLTNVSPIFNFGILNEVAVTNSSDDVEYAALRFDLTSIAPGVEIEGATLEVYIKDATDEIPGPMVANLFTRTWAEGTENGTTVSGATWQRADVGVDWTTPGGDIDQATIGSCVPTATEMPCTFALSTAAVQAWIDSPLTNFGMRIGPDPNAAEVHWHFRSKEEVAQGPILTVYLRE